MTPDQPNPSDESTTQAAAVFRSQPELRARLTGMPELARFREQFRELTIDGEKLFIRSGEPMVSGGDVPIDEDQLLLEFARAQQIAF